MLDRKENFAISALAVLVGCVLIFMIYSFSGVSDGYKRIEAIVSASAERLDALETNKAKATARRFTADDAADLMRCLEIPYSHREPCLAAIRQRFEPKE